MWFDLRRGNVELGSRTSTWGGSLLQIGWMFIRLAIRCGVSRGGMLEESDLATIHCLCFGTRLECVVGALINLDRAGHVQVA